MTTRLSQSSAAMLFLVAAVTVAGCAKKPPPLAPTKAPDVVVALPVSREYTDYEEFTGRTEAFESVDIRPEVTGKLVRIHFADGQEVNTAAPLFEIDDRVFVAERNSARGAAAQAKASIDQYKASVTKSKAEAVRAEASFQRIRTGFDKNIESRENYDKALSDRDAANAAVEQAAANVKSAEAALETAAGNLDKAEEMLGRTKIAAPFTGRLSDRRVFAGNIVKENDTILTTLIRLDKIYVSFDIDERTLLRLRRLLADGKITSARDANLVVGVGLADEEGYSYSAVMTFFDNALDQNTGTLRVRAEMSNPTIQRLGALPGVIGSAAAVGFEQKGLRLLSPKMFLRVRLPVGKSRPGLLVPEEALVSNQGEKLLYVVNEKNEVQERRVKLGPQDDKLRVIETGLAATDRVITKGQQRVRPGVQVNPRPEGQTPKK
jgi:RND family efflux transporter MFP subunit